MKESAAQGHVGLLLAGSMCLLPFLVPYHQPPVLSFYSEWLAAALGACAALSVLARGGTIVSVPAPALWLSAFALFLAVRAAGDAGPYPQTNLLAALYVLYAAVMVWLGAQLVATLGVERVAIVLAACLLGGALANAFAGIVQFYGRPALLEDLVAGLAGRRAYGNIAQPNLYANYLALGEIAVAFLWLRLRMHASYAALALILIAAGSAISGSRAALAYALWFVALAHLAGRIEPAADARRLKLAAYALAGCVWVVHFVLPWLNSALHLGPASEGAFDRLLAVPDPFSGPRWQLYSIAVRVFGAAPIAGVGMGGFAGAAFDLGFDPALARIAELWTSPHNLPLQLLAETGLVGAVLAMGGLVVWAWPTVRRLRSHPQPALWWLSAAAGVGLIHSLFEFPLWSAHFLGTAALLMGATLEPSRLGSRALGLAAGASCAVLLLSLALLLRDYVRLDASRITGTAVTLASPADARQDAATMRGLTHGLLGPVAELWIVSGALLDRNDLDAKVAMSGRVARFWPSHEIIVRRAALLALHGEGERARALLEPALRTFPHRRSAAIRVLEQASTADANAIRPLLDRARSK
jgi:O-antigen ligase